MLWNRGITDICYTCDKGSIAGHKQYLTYYVFLDTQVNVTYRHRRETKQMKCNYYCNIKY